MNISEYKTYHTFSSAADYTTAGPSIVVTPLFSHIISLSVDHFHVTTF